MAEVKLQVEKRDTTGKGVARRARAAGKVPGVVYGRGMEAVPVAVDRREFVNALNTDAGMNVLLALQLDGETIPALARDLQRDPVKGTLLHADFVKVDLTVEVEIEIRVHVIGESPGVKEGGVLDQPLHQLRIRCLPTAVPEQIEADISALDIGDSLRVSELPGGDFTILEDPERTVVTISQPISEEQLEAMEAAAGIEAEEPEEVPEEGVEEGAEVPEGEAPTEGEGAPEGEAPAEQEKETE